MHLRLLQEIVVRCFDRPLDYKTANNFLHQGFRLWGDSDTDIHPCCTSRTVKKNKHLHIATGPVKKVLWLNQTFNASPRSSDVRTFDRTGTVGPVIVPNHTCKIGITWGDDLVGSTVSAESVISNYAIKGGYHKNSRIEGAIQWMAASVPIGIELCRTLTARTYET